MKTLLALLCLLACQSFAERPEPRTIAWLEKGCEAIVAIDKDPSKATEEQRTLSTELRCMFDGFGTGIGTASFGVGESGTVLDTIHIQRFPAEIAREILEFCRQYRKFFKPDMRASRVMQAWYLSSHPKATREQRTMGLRLLDPGNQELAKLADDLK